MAKAILARQGIYCIRNTISGRVYVGSALRIDLRWNVHVARLRRGNHHSRLFQASWDKHGESAFALETLELVANPDDLIGREQFWIDRLGAAGLATGLNMSPVAGRALGPDLDDQTRARMSAAQSGRKHSPETIAKMSAAAKNRSAEYRSNMAEIQSGKTLSDETRAKISAAKTGHKMSGEALANIRAASRIHTPEARAKAGRALRGVTYEQAEMIRAMKAAGSTFRALAALFGMGATTIRNIVARNTYANP